ncbi:MAG: hypothetical protein IT317_10520 [Anaerolineales bacterium]|nr:hypothetical protein [Anaerolineales bacterium]
MKKHLHPLLTFSLLAVLALGTSLTFRPALADGPDFFVQPGTVSNAAATNAVIYGANVDWPEGTLVVLDGVGALATTRVSNTVLTVVIPQGLTPGVYGMSVINANSAVPPITKAGVLTVTGATSTPPATAFVRPLLTVQSYGASSATITPGTDLDFEMTFVNSGGSGATNIIVTFATGDFTPRVTGGVRSVRNLGPGESDKVFQPLTANRSLAGNSTASLAVNVTYTDANGQGYSGDFTLTFPVTPSGGGPVATSTPTPTPTQRVVLRPQLLITAYTTDVELLQPGTRFTLHLDVQNLGAADARRITMIAGGGTAGGGDGSGTPTGPGGVSGSGGDFSHFAPVNSSNVQSLGDLAQGQSLSAEQTFVVNATTTAGAYPMEFSFIYGADSGNYTDDQVITLLVYELPQVDMSLYLDPGPFFQFQPNLLPVQIVNLGRKTSVLGNMRVSAASAGVTLANNIILVGALDPGGFFTLDASVIPDTPGPLELYITVDYTDDFNQQRTITDTVTVEVIENVPIDPDNGGDGGGEPPPPVVEPETFWDKVVRFLKGLFGLDSGIAPDGGGVFPDGGGVAPDGGGIAPDDGGVIETTPAPINPRGLAPNGSRIR